MTIEYKRLNKAQEADTIIKETKDFVGDRFYVLDDALPYLIGRAGYYCFGAYEDEKLIAIGFGKLLDEDVLGYYRRFVSDFLLDDLLEQFFNKKCGVMNVFTVHPDYQNSNILDDITYTITKNLTEILEMTCELIFVDMPVMNDNLYESRLKAFDNLEYTKFGEIEDFWKDYTHDRKDCVCQICGDVCSCKAIILYKPRD